MSKPSTIVILTGAGISAESGLPTFRDVNGLWEGHRIEEVATPEAFARTPWLVHEFYNQRRAALRKAEPNDAHYAIARLQQSYPGEVVLVTQNVDDLHEQAETPSVIHMHGELRKVRCENCWKVVRCGGDVSIDTPCPSCEQAGFLRPLIVWFGEAPFEMDRIERTLQRADLFVAIGTSGVVYPAAGFVRQAKLAGAETIEINNAVTEASGHFDRHLTGPATEQVPAWVAELLA
ncbi:MAG: NAD-dependent deacylase [Verrucomicrobiaceae bacterium]|nr:NAD-dependent deacylase [Verrucomicrobiaceae bacterium]